MVGKRAVETLAPHASALAADGYVVLPQVVPEATRRAALRLLNMAIRDRGLSADEIASCQHATFFPDLRRHPVIRQLFPEAAAELLRLPEAAELAEPQLLLRFPDAEQDWPPVAHVDSPPEWAGGRRYLGIVGIALTAAGIDEGTVMVWPGSHRGVDASPAAIPLGAGDAIVMHPLLGHSGSLNLGPNIRYSVYFRPLEPLGAPRPTAVEQTAATRQPERRRRRPVARSSSSWL